MTAFEDKLFALIHGLPIPKEPAQHLRPSDYVSPMQKFHEQMIFRHAMSQTTSSASKDYQISELLEKFTAPRDSRDNPDEATALRKLFAPRDVRDETSTLAKFTAPNFGAVIPVRVRDDDLLKHAPLKDKSGAVTYEETIIGTDKWRHGYDSKGELVSAYLLGPGE